MPQPSPRNRYRPKRQWGTEREVSPLPHFHPRPSTHKVAWSRLSIILTITFWILYLISVIFRQLIESPASYDFTLDVVGYVIVVTLLTFSALMYLVARQGAFQRFSNHIRVPRALLDAFFADKQPSITVLVPSYSEEVAVIRKTLLSAALQEYPHMKIVLLLDDNPFPQNPVVKAKLESTRKLPDQLQQLLAEPVTHFRAVYQEFESAHGRSATVSKSVVLQLARQYSWAADWLEQKAHHETIEDHVDVFFAEQVLVDLAKDLRLTAEALEASVKDKATLAKARVSQLYRRLVWIFQAEITVFERKKFASLSHEANKAMNLNAYIGLMGGRYQAEVVPQGTLLHPIGSKGRADFEVADSDYILTLDADSVLLREYCLRLVYFLEQPDNSRVAVTQTPYSSFRGAATRIERLSGATTDIQHILHQGMSHYGATFWVGANAVIRKKALEEIVETEWQGGFEVKRYIQDATVIEDTESSVDLIHRGWQLVNYPERLSYSATPPDFGSLVVQRRRWSNGGLLILPKLFAQIRQRRSRNEAVGTAEILLRLNYLASTAWSSFGLLFLLAYPYDGRLLSPLVLLAALPYFLAMADDLHYCRYKYSDIIRIYGFNLILLPVNIAGVLKSIQQGLTAKKIPFARTPKVKNRTSAGLTFVLSPLLIVGFSLFTLWRNIQGEHWGNAAFAAFNAFSATWAIVAYIGLDNMLVDIWLGLTNFLYTTEKPSTSKTISSAPKLDWKAVLYHGENEAAAPHHAAHQLLLHNPSRSRKVTS